jgi:hypothetical protein
MNFGLIEIFMTDYSKGRIGMSSRYFEPFRILRAKISSESVFKLVYNLEKNNFHMPYLYGGYKCVLEPLPISTKIINSIKEYLDDNLFDNEERKLLLTELRPFIEKFGEDTTARLTERINLATETSWYVDDVLEYRKTIDALRQINQIVTTEFSKLHLMTSDSDSSVFISYSHDNEAHKDWVLQLATRLRSNGVNVILDRWNLKLGGDLASFMERGVSKSRRVVCICSEAYLRKANDGKGGAGYEKQIMTSELLADQNTNWIIPLIKNNPSDRKTPIFLGTRLYISFEESQLYESKYEELLRDLLDEPILPIPPIGKNPFQTIKEFARQSFIPASEKYVSPATKGVVTFDYSNNNKMYMIGQGELMFETRWSKGSKSSIHIYNDPISIKSVAIAKDIDKIAEIKDARNYDSSSRSRLVKLNQVAILQNSNGFYAAVKVISIKDDTRGDECDELRFEYVIQTNGSPDFTN